MCAATIIPVNDVRDLDDVVLLNECGDDELAESVGHGPAWNLRQQLQYPNMYQYLLTHTDQDGDTPVWLCLVDLTVVRPTSAQERYTLL